MAKQNISTEFKLPERRVKSTLRNNCDSTMVYKAPVPTSERKVFVAKKGPTFLNVLRYPCTATQPRVARLGCYLCAYGTGLVNLSRIRSDCHCELVPVSGVFGSLLLLKSFTSSTYTVSNISNKAVPTILSTVSSESCTSFTSNSENCSEHWTHMCMTHMAFSFPCLESPFYA